ncbi:BZ3500_MvSof-1268-A1-R1_Chr4-3g07249 [Microbotryum saponariae]|uniref:BZ3500_MvSof-1268-A1-R1_Chr4-3g07249 protein n=1 Tax=Microbotryum saponariae TaxID=289078 RepID=A0A2X0LFC4_9BASI|nr:BZ3500_MvSof-1268-A1-R1_Chr4-3g07249 [Microbotryum saponariae]SDA06912.1 BZ3501_MvSof-1269-A2-R1_Chr4-2g06958 [Microbotryum saponariae]
MSKLRLSSTLSKRVPRTRPLSLHRHAFKPSLGDELDAGNGPSRLLDGKERIKPDQLILPVLREGFDSGNKRKNQKDRTFLGVRIPTKPEPPGPEDCCQSGCAICVYDSYLSSIEEYHDALSSTLEELRNKIQQQSLRVEAKDWPAELGPFDAFVKRGASQTVQGAKERAEDELKRVKSSLDPSLRAFLEMEARLKAKQNAEA